MRSSKAAAVIVASALAGALVAADAGASTTTSAKIAAWRSSVRFAPLTDAKAAAHVRPARETRPANRRANRYEPSALELRRFRAARDDDGRTARRRNPFLARVTGGFAGSTDEIIQWAAWKWGIPEDWLRAQYANESLWRQGARGDRTFVGPDAVLDYPPQSRDLTPAGAYTGWVWMSLGISQVKWSPDGSHNAGTEPLRWKSTAFAADYQAATVRWYYDDPHGLRSAWGDGGYERGQPWLSIAAWFNPYPWRNHNQLDYVAEVRRLLRLRPWEHYR